MTTDPKMVDVAKAAGVSYRQADWWVRHGYVQSYLTTRDDPNNQPAPHNAGSGFVRHLTPHEAHILHLLAALVDMGMNAAPAAPIARQLAGAPHIPVVHGPIAVTVVG